MLDRGSLKIRLLEVFVWLLCEPLKFILDILYRNDRQQLPPIKNPILLESASSLAYKIRTKQVKSVDVLTAYIARIREVQPSINAVVHERFQEALQDARNVDEFVERSEMSEEEIAKNKPLLGVPFTVKDTIPIKGMKLTAGFFPMKDHEATDDAETVALLRKAGAIPVAITNVPELAAWHDSCNMIYGRTKNPYRSARIAGGSSGGEGALISSAGSILGVGSDFAGSIRIPAFCCGIFGHKPTAGIVPMGGHFPMPIPKLNYMIVQGPMCRYASDLRLAFKVLAGDKAADLKLDEKVSIKDLKIYYMDEFRLPLAPPLKPEMKECLQKVLDHFRQKYNMTPVKANLKEMNFATEMWASKYFKVDTHFSVYSLAGDGENEISPLKELVKHPFGQATHTLALLFFGGLEKLYRKFESREFSEHFSRMTDNFKKKLFNMLGKDGVFLFPSQSAPAMYHRETITNTGVLGYTAIFNALEMPVTQCPLGLGPEGLPLGVQVAAAPNNDRLTIAVAEEIEKALGGWVSPAELP